MKVKKLSNGGSIYNTTPLMKLIYSYAKTKDCKRMAATSKLVKHLHFRRPLWLPYSQRLIVYSGINFNQIVFPRKYNKYRFNV